MKKQHSELNLKSEEAVRPVLKEKFGLNLYANLWITPKNLRKDFHLTQSITVFIIKEGSGLLEFNSERIPLQKHMVVEAPPGKHVRIVPNEEGIQISILSYTNKFLFENNFTERHSDIVHFVSTLFSQIWNISPAEFQRIMTSYDRVLETMDTIDTHFFGKTITILQFQIFLFEMAALRKKYTQISDLNFSRKEKLAMQFSRLVLEQFRTQRKLSHYADQMHISTKYLTELIKQISGKNASEIINNLVIIEAKTLLRNNELTIANIAESLNFSDQSFFGKFFKRNTGMSPKAYQMKLGKKTED